MLLLIFCEINPIAASTKSRKESSKYSHEPNVPTEESLTPKAMNIEKSDESEPAEGEKEYFINNKSDLTI